MTSIVPAMSATIILLDDDSITFAATCLTSRRTEAFQIVWVPMLQIS